MITNRCIGTTKTPCNGRAHIQRKWCLRHAKRVLKQMLKEVDKLAFEIDGRRLNDN